MPKIAKNLLSVLQLTSDNNVTIEFDENNCLIKDKQLGVLVLKETLKDGLNKLQVLYHKSS